MREGLRRLPPWGGIFIVDILIGVSSNFIYDGLKQLLSWLRLTDVIVIALTIGALATGILLLILRLTTWFKFEHKLWAMILTFGLVTIIAIFIGKGFVTPLEIKEIWNFEDCTVQGWGLFDENKGRVILSSDIVTSTQIAQGACSLMVNNIDLLAPPKLTAYKKWPAVRYEGDLSNAIVTASVYIPADAVFRYADAKLFLFDNQWKWHESGSGGRGSSLEQGEWIELSWDLRFHNTLGWPFPWKRILGIQLYIEGSFKGPVFIDNVKVYK